MQSTARYVVFDDRNPAKWVPWTPGADLTSIDEDVQRRPDSVRDTWPRVHIRLKLMAADELFHQVKNFSEYVGAIIDAKRIRNDFDRLQAEHRQLLDAIHDAPNPLYATLRYHLVTVLPSCDESEDDRHNRLERESVLRTDATDILGPKKVGREVLPVCDAGGLVGLLSLMKTQLSARLQSVRHRE